MDTMKRELESPMRPDYWAPVATLGAAQYGLVGSAQVLAIGCPEQSLWLAVKNGQLSVYRTGVFLIAGAPPSIWQPLTAACLAGGDTTYASHLGAASVYGYERVLPGTVEVTSFGRTTRRLTGIRAHRTTQFDIEDVTTRNGIPVTSPARTVIDCGASLSLFLLARLIDHLIRRNECDVDQLHKALERLGGRGRAGTTVLRMLIDERLGGLRPGDSDLEVKVLRALLRHGVARPVQGHQVVVGRRVFLLDLAWPASMVGVEILGFEPHGTTRTPFDHDQERMMLLVGAGWRILPVTSRTDLSVLARTLKDLLRGPCRDPLPDPGGNCDMDV